MYKIGVMAQCNKQKRLEIIPSLSDFIDSLNSEQFEKIQQFYEGTPKLSHKVKVKNPKTEVESEIEIEGLQSFLE